MDDSSNVMLRPMAGRRWDDDERGEGVADARALASGAEDLVDAMRRPNWVAEQPEVHLLPHLQQSCESLPFELVGAQVSEDGSYDVELRWTGETARIGEVRAAVFTLVGGFAEVYTYVRQRRGADAVVFEVVTGILGEESSFSPHGHTVRLSVAGVR
jgi:hypothetical protein